MDSYEKVRKVLELEEHLEDDDFRRMLLLESGLSEEDELTINIELSDYEQKLYEEMKLSKQMKQTYNDLDSVIVQDILRNTFKK